jgi:hypothetical protein
MSASDIDKSLYDKLFHQRRTEVIYKYHYPTDSDICGLLDYYCHYNNTCDRRAVVVIVDCVLRLVCMVNRLCEDYDFEKLAYNIVRKYNIDILFKCTANVGHNNGPTDMVLSSQPDSLIRPSMLVVVNHLGMNKDFIVNHIKLFGRSSEYVLLISKQYGIDLLSTGCLKAYKTIMDYKK